MLMNPPEKIGDLIRRKRKEKGWSQTDLAERIGRSQRMISGIETGQRRLTRDSSIALLADALGIPYDELAVAAGVVHTREAAMQLRRLADELNADEKVRIEQAHAALDPYLRYLPLDDLESLVRVADSITKRYRPNAG